MIVKILRDWDPDEEPTRYNKRKTLLGLKEGVPQIWGLKKHKPFDTNDVKR